MRNCIRYSRSLPSPSRNLPARHYLAGYLIDNRVALKLSSTVSGLPIPTAQENYTIYPPSTPIKNSIEKVLWKKGLNSRVQVQLAGNDEPFGTIIVTQERYKFKGPLSMIIQGGKEKAVREWLESKGNFGIPRSPLSYPIYRNFSGGVPVGGRVRLGLC